MARSRAFAAADTDPRGGLRLASLDAFRGFTIAAMVLVNNPGSWSHIYSQLDHARWNGWTFTDWIFPFFLFICGVAMALSLERRLAEGASRGAIVASLARRAAILFALGIGLNLFPTFDFATVRIPGVLQRIGLCVLIAAPIAAYLDWKRQAWAITGLLAVYAFAMICVPVPDAQGRVAAGILEPGRDFGSYLDRMLLEGHLWARAKTWDPEGLWSTLPAVASLLFGLLAGRWLQSTRSEPAARTVWMLLVGLLAVWMGAILDAILMPINKSLWSVSYTVFTAGWGLVVFAAFYWLMDAADSERVRGSSRKLFLPFTIYGLNAILLFVVSGLIARLLGYFSIKPLLYASLESLPLAPVNASLLYAVLFNLVIFALAWALWRRGWFVKV